MKDNQFNYLITDTNVNSEKSSCVNEEKEDIRFCR